MPDVRLEIADVLRGRILRGLRGGALQKGDRLPGARELNAEFNADHRIILDAFRILAKEGLVELRPRGGVYVVYGGDEGEAPLPSKIWLTEVFTQAVAREISLVELHDWMRRVVETRRIRVVAIQATVDQLGGFCRELKDDYGVHADGVEVASLDDPVLPHELRCADLLITSPAFESVVRPVAERLGTKMMLAKLNPDLIGGEWRLLLGRPVYVIVKDERFASVVREFFSNTPGAQNIRPLVLGRDDLSTIPDKAPVYVTRIAREHLGGRRIPGRMLPTARLFSAETARALIDFIVGANLDALAPREGSRDNVLSHTG